MDFCKLPTAANLENYIRELLRAHPQARTFCVGKSVLGRKIPVLTLGNTCGCALFVGATHGSEWLTSLLLLRFFDEVCAAFEHGKSLCGVNVGRAVFKRGIAVIPVLNPDGVEINLRGAVGALSAEKRVSRLSGGDFSHWNANARGVDLNHNFAAGWETLQKLEHEAGIYGPAPGKYGGPRPFSEPETRAVCGFCSTFNVRRLYSFHSQGEEIYWYYGPETPLLSREIGERLAEASGYKMILPEGTASHGGLKDWYIKNFRRPGFTIEIGKGENPLPLEDLDGIYEKIEKMLAEMLAL